jgi:hypothetical protein
MILEGLETAVGHYWLLCPFLIFACLISVVNSKQQIIFLQITLLKVNYHLSVWSKIHRNMRAQNRHTQTIAGLNGCLWVGTKQDDIVNKHLNIYD